jgi:hypothetical protein
MFGPNAAPPPGPRAAIADDLSGGANAAGLLRKWLLQQLMQLEAPGGAHADPMMGVGQPPVDPLQAALKSRMAPRPPPGPDMEMDPAMMDLMHGGGMDEPEPMDGPVEEQEEQIPGQGPRLPKAPKAKKAPEAKKETPKKKGGFPKAKA